MRRTDNGSLAWRNELLAYWPIGIYELLLGIYEPSKVLCHFPRVYWCSYNKLISFGRDGIVLNVKPLLSNVANLPSHLRTTTHKLSLVTRKPVFGVFNQVRLKPVCLATGTSQKLEILKNPGSEQQKRWSDCASGCAGWSAPLLFTYGKTGFRMTWLN